MTKHSPLNKDANIK